MRVAIVHVYPCGSVKFPMRSPQNMSVTPTFVFAPAHGKAQGLDDDTAFEGSDSHDDLGIEKRADVVGRHKAGDDQETVATVTDVLLDGDEVSIHARHVTAQLLSS